MDELSADLSLVAEGLSKSFSGVRVLDDVTLRLGRGEVVGLIGQNGSGKSTLIKVLSGFHEPDDGARVHMGPDDVTAHLGAGPARTGMAFIHQDLALVPAMTILENLRIARFTTGVGGRIRWREERATVRAALDRVGVSAAPDTPVGELSVTDRALVAVARGLSDVTATTATDGRGTAGHRLLVLDEPTAYLPAAGVDRLFDAVRALADDGVSVLFVSHRLDEVLAHCDRVAVLRGGRLVADVPAAGRTERDLIELMLGRPPELLYPDLPDGQAGAALRVDDLAGGRVDGVSFTAAPGEIVGFVGLPGHGYDELPYLVAGAARSRSGRVGVDGNAEVAAATLTPGRAARLGIALLPADRKAASGALGVSVGENMTLPTLGRFASLRVLLRGRRERACVAGELARFEVTPPRGEMPLGLLSGGNQQKVLLAKWLLAAPRVLALHEPTHGVDVGAKRDVFTHLVALARAGTVVLLSSVEFDDLAHLCTRVHVLRDGRIVATLRRGELTAHAIAEAVHGPVAPEGRAG